MCNFKKQPSTISCITMEYMDTVSEDFVTKCQSFHNQGHPGYINEDYFTEVEEDNIFCSNISILSRNVVVLTVSDSHGEQF